VLLAVALALGCGSPADPQRSVDSNEPPRAAILILLDTVRADRVGAYGHARPTSPVLDAMAERGVLFEQTVSYAPWTLPSVVALLSGDAADRAFRGRLSRSLVGSFARDGFATAAITEGALVSSKFGLDLHFDEFVEEEGAVHDTPPGEERETEADGGIENTFRLAREWIREHEQDRFLLLIHTYEPHTPYTRRAFTDGLEPGAVGETLQLETVRALKAGEVSFDDRDLEYLSALYDGGILESDRYVGELLEFLSERGLRDETLVVVTSDHGEELGDHFPVHCGDHGHSLLDDQLLVPLIIDDPTASYPVSRVTAQVRTMDILPTIADLLGVKVEDRIDGATLAPLMRGEDDEGRVAYGGAVDKGQKRVFVRHLGYKFIRELDRPVTPPAERLPIPRIQLYDLRSDPDERHNLADTNPDLVQRFRDMSLTLVKEATSRDTERFKLSKDLDEDLKERLRSLGYVD